MPPILDEGVCVRQWDWSETSQTVTLLCRSLGLVRGLAKGAKRPTHPFSGGIELLTRGRVGVIVRPSSDLALLTEWDLQETFPPLRASLAAHHVGLYFAELVQHAVQDHDPHERLFDELMWALRSLGSAWGRALAIQRFQWAVLVETGYMPVLDRDVVTGESLVAPSSQRQRTWYYFDPAMGGVRLPSSAAVTLAERAVPGAQELPPARAWRVRRETLELLRVLGGSWDQGPRPAGEGGASPMDAASALGLDRANRLLASYLRYVFGREPRMLPVLFGPKLPR